MDDITKARWWSCIPAAVLCLALIDAALALWWHPHPQRLPEQFSGAYLQRYVDDERGHRPVVVLGDSVLWGYRLAANDAAMTLVAGSIADPVLNLSYEGGSSANSYFMLRYLLAEGVAPRAVVLGINSKETNPADSAYDRLHPSLERDVLPMLTADDRRALKLSSKDDVPAKLDGVMARVWALYRYRTDLRQALFGTDDASLAFRDMIQRWTGSAGLAEAAHRPTADRFLGTYDLGPLAPDNIDAAYLGKIAALLREHHIPLVAFLTPTNHALLHDYIDDPSYDAKLAALAAVAKRSGFAALDFDKSMPTVDFIDNDHLTVDGNRRLASLLLPALRKAVRP